MDYFIQGEGISYDNLINDINFPVEKVNITLSGGADKGDILAGSSGIFTKIASSADKNKVLCIASEDVESTDSIVTTAFFAGKFNIGALSFGACDVVDFEDSLRKSNIILSQNMEV